MARASTGALGLGDVGDEGHEAGSAEELGHEDGRMPLSLGALDPLQARPQNARITAPFPQDPTPVTAHDSRSTTPNPTSRPGYMYNRLLDMKTANANLESLGTQGMEEQRRTRKTGDGEREGGDI